MWLGIIVTVIAFATIAVMLVYERPKRHTTHAGRMAALGAAVRFARKENENREPSETGEGTWRQSS